MSLKIHNFIHTIRFWITKVKRYGNDISGRGFQEALKVREKPEEGEKRGGHILPTFLASKSLKPFIESKLDMAKLEPIIYRFCFNQPLYLSCRCFFCKVTKYNDMFYYYNYKNTDISLPKILCTADPISPSFLS